MSLPSISFFLTKYDLTTFLVEMLTDGAYVNNKNWRISFENELVQTANFPVYCLKSEENRNSRLGLDFKNTLFRFYNENFTFDSIFDKSQPRGRVNPKLVYQLAKIIIIMVYYKYTGDGDKELSYIPLFAKNYIDEYSQELRGQESIISTYSFIDSTINNV
jgi:hypothetical protein